MDTTTQCRHLTSEDLYRTILLEEGCDVRATGSERPAPSRRCRGVTVYSAEATRWVPQFRVMFGDLLAG